MLRHILIVRSGKRKVSLFVVVILWLSYLVTRRPHDSVRENTPNISKSRSKIRNQSQKGPSCQPNMSAADMTGFDSFFPSIRDFLYYQHCRHFPLLQHPPDKCSQDEDVFLLLVIKTSPGNYERREVLRKTWAKETQINGLQLRRIFITGTAGEGFDKIRTNKLLEAEQREHNDIIQWDFRDTHCNLTLKQVLFFQWLYENCLKTHFLFNGDDDIYAHSGNMVEYLQSLQDNDGSRHLFTGFVKLNEPCVRQRENKYFVPFEFYRPDLYPPYCSGAGILMSRYTALLIYRMSQFIPLFPMDDVYLGMILAKAGLNLTSHAGVKTVGYHIPTKNLDQLDPCFYKDLLLVHRFHPKELYTIWHRVHDPELKCF